jgi:hypothetical protein
VIKAAIPRLYIPLVLPGARIGVLIDPTNPMKVSPDLGRINAPSAAVVGAAIPTTGGVRSGSVNTIRGSADQLLATGTHGMATITMAMPLGKTVRDINPAADPSRLNDPLWLFTVEVTLAGEAPSPPSSAIACRWPSSARWRQASSSRSRSMRPTRTRKSGHRLGSVAGRRVPGNRSRTPTAATVAPSSPDGIHRGSSYRDPWSGDGAADLR